MKTMAVAFGCFCLLGLSVHSGERLSVRITPPVAMAPAAITVRTTIETSPTNRTLEIVAQSDSYYRSSQVGLDGDRAPRINEMVFKGLPAGKYEISAILIDDRGTHLKATRIFQATGGGER